MTKIYLRAYVLGSFAVIPRARVPPIGGNCRQHLRETYALPNLTKRKPISMQSMNQLLRLPEVKNRTGASRSTIYALEAAGRFPRHVNLGARCTAWVASEVDAWIMARIADRDA